MTEPTSPPPTDKLAREMNPAERAAFIAQCKKLETSPQQRPVETTKRAKDMSDAEKQEWLSNYKRGLA
jgi:hypothetical protein